MRFTRLLVRTVALVVLLEAAPLSEARADGDEPTLYARVVADTTILRSGPGPTFRRAYVAHRGDVFPVLERASQGYWFRVELPDGTTGWILGDAVYNEELSDEQATSGRFLPWLFAPPPLPEAAGEISVAFGALGGGGMMAVRPTVLVHGTFGVEATAAAAVSQGGRLLFGALGGIVNLFPESPLVPFVVAGCGYAWSDPNADTFLLKAGSIPLLYGGGGLRFGFRYRLVVRVDFRIHAFYEADRYITQEEISGGLTAFF